MAAHRPRNAEKTRAALLDAALGRFAQSGYAATTVREIADEAGVNVALVSRYFTSKEGLFEACLTRAVKELRAATGDVPVERIPEVISRQAAGSVEAGGPNHILLLLLRSSGDERADRIRVGVLRSFAERLAAVAGPELARPDERLLRAQILIATSIGIVLLRSMPGLEPLAGASELDLVAPLRDVMGALLPS